MFVLLICTVLVANVSLNLHLALGAVEATESRYISFAVANQLLSDLGAGNVQVGDYTKSRPNETINEGYTTHSWVEQLNDGNVLVVAKTFRSGHSKPEVVKRLAVYKDFDLTRVYTNRNDNNPSSPDPVFYSETSSGSGAWSKLPNFPRQRVKDDGTLDVRPENGGTLFWVSGDPNGNMYGVYAPALDGWGDVPSPLSIVPIIAFPWGKITLKTIVAGTSRGMTLGDLTPIAQAMINNLTDFAVTKGTVFMKFDPNANDWKALPPPPEATIQMEGGKRKAVVQSNDFHIKGAGGVFATYEGGALMPVYRQGGDTIYRYTDATEKFEVMAPPDEDILLMAADQQGTAFVQTGTIQPVGIAYFLRVLFEDFSAIQPGITGTGLWKREGEEWVKIPDPPAEFYNKAGEIRSQPYNSSRGPTLGGMTGGENGEFYVCNRPFSGNAGEEISEYIDGLNTALLDNVGDGKEPDLSTLPMRGRGRSRGSSELVDTVYKYTTDGKWELVPSPPNKAIDPVTGKAVDQPGLPDDLEIGQAASGRLIVRESGNGLTPDPIFVQTQGGSWDMLPPVRTEGGPFEVDLAQISGGRRREGTRGAYVVKATYF